MKFRLKSLPHTSTLAVLLALVLSLAATACQDQPATDDTVATDTAATGTVVGAADDAAAADTPAAAPGASDAESAATRAALPRLFSIMVGLQGDMERISRGIWTESYDSIATAARAVADHPMIGAEGIARIQGVLADDMARFKGMDTNVHDLAVEVEEHATARDVEAVLDAEARLRLGCVECHTAFRQRLRDAF